MAYNAVGKAVHDEWVRHARAQAARRKPTYYCAVCGHGPLRLDSTARARARLCIVCWYERKTILQCSCQRIQGKTKAAYACSTCERYGGKEADANREAMRLLEEIDGDEEEKRCERYHLSHRNGKSFEGAIR